LQVGVVLDHNKVERVVLVGLGLVLGYLLMPELLTRLQSVLVVLVGHRGEKTLE